MAKLTRQLSYLPTFGYEKSKKKRTSTPIHSFIQLRAAAAGLRKTIVWGSDVRAVDVIKIIGFSSFTK